MGDSIICPLDVNTCNAQLQLIKPCFFNEVPQSLNMSLYAHILREACLVFKLAQPNKFVIQFPVDYVFQDSDECRLHGKASITFVVSCNFTLSFTKKDHPCCAKQLAVALIHSFVGPLRKNIKSSLCSNSSECFHRETVNTMGFLVSNFKEGFPEFLECYLYSI